jgi:hypothetical protein
VWKRGSQGLLSSAGSTSNLETNEIEVARFGKDRASDGRSRFFYFVPWITRTGLLEAISNQPVLDAQTSTKIIDKTGAFCQETAA